MLTPTHHLTNEEYHAHPAISRSSLGLVAQSPLHFWHRHYNSAYVPSLPTPQMRLGTAVHAAVLEPALFKAEYVLAPDMPRTTKAGKEAWAAAAADGAELLTASEMGQILAMRDALLAHPAGQKILDAPGINEASFITTDPGTGIEIKCRPDRLTDSNWIVDLKTTKDASAPAFQKSVANFGYHIQAAIYMHVLDVLGQRPKGFLILAIEKDAPYAVQAFQLSADSIFQGTKEMHHHLATLKYCLTHYPITTPWPAYNNEIQELSLPSWAVKA